MQIDSKKIGFAFLVKTIGEKFFEAHKDTAVFSWEEDKDETYCFLGIDLKNCATATLSASVEEWDVYATCIVKNGRAVLDKCRLPKEEN